MRSIRLQITLLLCLAASMVTAQETIHLSQLGYYPDNDKVAVLTDTSASTFSVVDMDGNEVFSDESGAVRKWDPSEEYVLIADFSKVDEPGTYQLVAGNDRSYPFEIANTMYSDLLEASVKAYYFNRASMKIEEKYGKPWHRPAGHPDDSVYIHPSAEGPERKAGDIISSSKGWYDAGDYNKYIVNSGISMYTLLTAYERYNHIFDTLTINFPEQNNALPDLIDEILWNLRWMQTMQDPADGGVYHKMTSSGFCGKIMPHQDFDKRWVVQKTTTATLDFAAVMAQASRVLRKFDDQLPGLADSCLEQAKKAWEWAEENPEELYFQDQMNDKFKPSVVTGAYDDKRVGDEKFWAAAELYVVTKDSKYGEALEWNDEYFEVPSWQSVGLLGIMTLARDETKANDYQRKARRKLMGVARSLSSTYRRSAYSTSMGHDIGADFVWGSNGVAGNHVFVLSEAYHQRSRKIYKRTINGNFQYLVGNNATGYSFVTGYGTKTPMHIHHRPSKADGVDDPVPGFLAGGPHPGRQDGCAYEHTEPAKAYVDSWCSYATNEITINWNAPLVYTVAAIINNNQGE